MCSIVDCVDNCESSYFVSFIDELLDIGDGSDSVCCPVYGNQFSLIAELGFEIFEIQLLSFRVKTYFFDDASVSCQ